MTNPAKPSAWQDAEEAQQFTDGPVRAGMCFRGVHKLMARRGSSSPRWLECEPGRLFHIRVVEGPPVDGRWEFAPTPSGGTRVTLMPLVHLSSVMCIAEPSAGADDRRLAFRCFHRRLKRGAGQQGAVQPLCLCPCILMRHRRAQPMRHAGSESRRPSESIAWMRCAPRRIVVVLPVSPSALGPRRCHGRGG